MVYNTVNQWEYSTLQYWARKQLKDRRVNRTGGISYRVKIVPLNSSPAAGHSYIYYKQTHQSHLVDKESV